MTEERPDLDATQENASEAPPEPSTHGQKDAGSVTTPNLLPRGYNIDHVRGKKTQVDAVEIARTDRHDNQKEERKQRRIQRNQERVQRKVRNATIERLHKLVFYLVIAVVFLAPLLIGGVHLVVMIPLACISLMAAACAVWITYLQRSRFRAGPIGWLLLGLTGISFLQAVPLPLGLIETLSGQVGEWLRYAWEGTTGGAPDFGTLSVNPGESARAGFGWLTATSLYLTAHNLFHDNEKFEKLLMVLPATGVTLVMVGVVQKVLNISERLFFYAPRDLAEAPFFASTFVNPNHLGTLLGMISFIPLGFSLNKSWKHYRSGMVILFTLCTAGMVMTLSFTAILSWALGLIGFGILMLRRRISNSKNLAYTSLAALAAIGAGLYAAWSQFAERVSFLSEHQGIAWFMPTAIWSDALDLALTSPLLGIGKGGFGDAFSAFTSTPQSVHHLYVNNTYLQLALDYGIPFALATMGVIAWTLLKLNIRKNWKETDMPLMASLFAAFAFLAFEANFSFSLEIPGVFLPAIFALGLMTGRSTRYRDTGSKSDKPRKLKKAPTLLKQASPLLILVGISMLAIPSAQTTINATRGLPTAALRQAATGPVSAEKIQQAYRESLTIRPIHGPVHLNAAIGLEAAGKLKESAAALERARHFEKSNPAPLVIEARAHLKQRNTDEALRAYTQALTLASTTESPGRHAIALEIARTWKSVDKIASALPEDQETWNKLLKTLLDEGSAGKVLKLCAVLRKQTTDVAFQNITDLWTAQAHAELQDWDKAYTRADQLLVPPPGPAQAYVIMVQALEEQGKAAQALQKAEEGLKHHAFNTDMLFATAELVFNNRQTLGFKTQDDWRRKLEPLLQQLKPSAIKNPGLRHRYYSLSGLYNKALGRLPSAISELRKAMEANPNNPRVLISLAELLERDRQVSASIDAYQGFLDRFPNHPQSIQAELNLKRLREQENLLKSFRDNVKRGNTSGLP